ncbi:MAG: thiamine pyrophosphate-dependent dehydrogenase E1 component subunit alpha, partial [Armatimonadetes bacterium]|nr:thiamine pyrophosphate-dependent dehydrogenase E1 component subunit alpha [Armatimonadota bacterium]
MKVEPKVLPRAGNAYDLSALIDANLRLRWAETDGAPFAVLAERGEPLNDELLPELPGEELRALHRGMILLRAMDTRCLALQRQGRIGFFVPSTGEEALMIGSAHPLRPEDWVFPAYRETGVALHRGFPPADLLCQLYGNEHDGLKGRQMPSHFGSLKYRFAVASSPVGTQIPQAVGAAWAARLRHESLVSVVYFGDGATSTGDFHAGMNLVGVMHLPVVLICKNNGWAI